MSWGRVQSVWKYVQRVGVRGAMSELAQQSVVKTEGRLVGKDKFGNQYFEDKTAPMLRDRWVVFATKDADPTTVPGEWHQWLHRIGDAPPESVAAERKFFQVSHTPNTTGVVFTEPDRTYTPHNFLLNKNFGTNYTADPLIEEWQPHSTSNAATTTTTTTTATPSSSKH